MSPQANLERVLAACQAMGAKMILPMMASRVHRMVVLENLPRKIVCGNVTVERLSCKGCQSPGSKYTASGKLVVGKWPRPMYGRVQHMATAGHGIRGRGILSAGPGMLPYSCCVRY